MKLICYYYILVSIFNESINNVNNIFFEQPQRVRRDVTNGKSHLEYQQTQINAYKKFINNLHTCKVERKSERVCSKYRNFFPITNMALFLGGGKSAKEAEFPHMVALGFQVENGYKFGCGGSLISTTFVLTAAHCIQNPENLQVAVVKVGTTVVPQFESKLNMFDIKVKRAISHPEYNRTTKVHDIALIELHQSVHFGKTVGPLCLYTGDDDPQLMEIVGWGEINFDGEKSPNLQKAVLPPVPKNVCEKLYSKRLKIKIESCHICAGNHDVNVCKGDSGGPLLLRSKDGIYQVGVVIYGEKCGTRTPGLYARVSSYLDWIENIVWNERN